MNINKFNAEHLQTFFAGGAHALKLNKSAVDALNVFPVPDGDTGTNMSLTVLSAVQEIQDIKFEDIRQVAKGLAQGALMGARGNSGVIFSQILRGISQGFNAPTASPLILAKALKKGADMAYNAVMKPVEGTILTVIREMANGAVAAAHDGADCLGVLEAAVKQGEITLNKTPQMLPALKQAGVVDAGGKGLLVVFQGGIAALKGEVADFEQEIKIDAPTSLQLEAEFGYCTEFLIRGTGLVEQQTRNDLAKMGDSLLVVGNENTLKIHIHTYNPGAVLEYAVKIGTLHDIKIDNMSDQHQEIVSEIPKKSLAVVAVVAGYGMEDIYMSLGADVTVSGGQSMNPSTEELLKAVEQAHAEEVILLPNNKNIILAAEQVKKVSNIKIHVIPTKNMLEGISAMTVYDTQTSAELNAKRMHEAYGHITSIEITYAVRDTLIEDLVIAKGDVLGLTDGVIKLKGKSPEEVFINSVKSSLKEEHEIITLFYGEGIEESRVEQIKELCAENFPDVELEIHNGGQPIYYYIASIE